ADVGGAELAPGVVVAAPVVGAALAQHDAALDADRVGVTAGRAGVLMELLGVLGHRGRWSAGDDPAIAKLRDAMQHGLGGSAEPERNWALNRQRVEAGLVDLVPAALERHDLLGPERAKDLDLLLELFAAGMEVLAERLVLDVVPTDAHPEPEPALREQV